jgi:hypothetical protein
MRILKSILLLIICMMFVQTSYGRDYIIYSVSQQLPMGNKEQKLRKNYYVNMGSEQGLKEGSKLDVFRIVSRYNPYDDSKRVNYKVRIGTLEVLHVEDEAAITRSNSLLLDDNDPVLSIDRFMIGDRVDISINN